MSPIGPGSLISIGSTPYSLMLPLSLREPEDRVPIGFGPTGVVQASKTSQILITNSHLTECIKSTWPITDTKIKSEDEP